MSVRRTVVNRLLFWYIRWVGGGDWPFLLVERRYLGARIPPGAAVADVGGGDGKLANMLAPTARRVLILDREATSLPGADKTLYAGSLARAMQERQSEKVTAVMGDATTLPFAAGSLDAVVSSQFLEHIPDAAKTSFFHECARVLAPGGVLAVSTPNGEYIAARKFRFSALARSVLSPSRISRLPRLMRGPWLEQDIAGWEARVGHYDHGCRRAHLRALSTSAGFDELDSRCLHTRLTSFWFELLCTFPLFFLMALPVVRLLYWIEASAPAADGINLMMTFRKRNVAAQKAGG